MYNKINKNNYKSSRSINIINETAKYSGILGYQGSQQGAFVTDPPTHILKYICKYVAWAATAVNCERYARKSMQYVVAF